MTRLLLLSALLAACTGSGSPVSGATRVVLLTAGGDPPQNQPAGSTCTPIDETFTLALDAKTLAWNICTSPTAGAPEMFVTGQRDLSDDELAAITDGLDAISFTATPCGSEIIDELSITTADGTTKYEHAECLPGEMDFLAQLQSSEH